MTNNHKTITPPERREEGAAMVAFSGMATRWHGDGTNQNTECERTGNENMNTDCNSKTRKPRRRERSRRYSRQTEPDCVKQMEMYRRRPEVLAEALLEMGVTEDGFEPPEEK